MSKSRGSVVENGEGVSLFVPSESMEMDDGLLGSMRHNKVLVFPGWRALCPVRVYVYNLIATKLGTRSSI